jgi:excisionase family DNA binding protein
MGTTDEMSERKNSVVEESVNRSISWSELLTLLNRLCAMIDSLQQQLAGVRKEWMTVEEVAQATCRSAFTVRRWISEGRLKATRVAGTGPKGRLLISRDQLDSLITDGLGAAISPIMTGPSIT